VKPRAKTDVPTSGGRWELSQESHMKPTANTEERHSSRYREPICLSWVTQAGCPQGHRTLRDVLDFFQRALRAY